MSTHQIIKNTELKKKIRKNENWKEPFFHVKEIKGKEKSNENWNFSDQKDGVLKRIQ